MKKEEFYNYVADHITDHMPESYNDAKVSLNEVKKNNETLMGISIIPTDNRSNITPCVYLKEFYDEYEKQEPFGADIDMFVARIATIYMNGLNVSFGRDIWDVTDYDKIKDNIYPRVVSVDGNEEFLKDKVYRTEEDLAVLYYVNLGESTLSRTPQSSVIITNALMSRYDISEEQLFEKAIENQRNLGFDFRNIQEFILERYKQLGAPAELIEELENYQPEDNRQTLYFLTNNMHLNGAAVMADKDLLASIAKEHDWDEFFIIPSSIHEIIIYPDTAMDADYVRNMIYEVNHEELKPSDRLSNNLYLFDAASREISIVGEEREESLD